MELQFEAGDLVEVRLVKKKTSLYYSPASWSISKFKIRLIMEVFEFLSRYKEIEQIIFFGSFLTKEVQYRDIDIFIIYEKTRIEIEEKIKKSLEEEFSLKFHIISATKEELEDSLEYSPLGRSMLFYCVSDKPLPQMKERKIKKDHIRFLLMMPEDLIALETMLKSRAYYDALRKVLIIKKFLKKEKEDSKEVQKKIEKRIGKEITEKIMQDEVITLEEWTTIKKEMSKEIKEVYDILKKVKDE